MGHLPLPSSYKDLPGYSLGCSGLRGNRSGLKKSTFLPRDSGSRPGGIWRKEGAAWPSLLHSQSALPGAWRLEGMIFPESQEEFPSTGDDLHRWHGVMVGSWVWTAGVSLWLPGNLCCYLSKWGAAHITWIFFLPIVTSTTLGKSKKNLIKTLTYSTDCNWERISCCEPYCTKPISLLTYLLISLANNIIMYDRKYKKNAYMVFVLKVYAIQIGSQACINKSWLKYKKLLLNIYSVRYIILNFKFFFSF